MPPDSPDGKRPRRRTKATAETKPATAPKSKPKSKPKPKAKPKAEPKATSGPTAKAEAEPKPARVPPLEPGAGAAPETATVEIVAGVAPETGSPVGLEMDPEGVASMPGESAVGERNNAGADETVWGADGSPELGSLLADAQEAVFAREERRQAERRQAERRAVPPRPIPDPPWFAAASISWLLVLLALLSPPAFLRQPGARPFTPTGAKAEPSMRYGLWLARHRVDDFRARAGRMPSFLGEAGMRDDAIRLEVTGERSYALTATVGRRTLRLTDRMAVDSFLGGSLEVLRAGD